MALIQNVVVKTNAAGRQVATWTPIERVLAIVCAFSPLVMALVDTKSLRRSISDYYIMDQNQLFYVPLTVAAMLFVVNGITKQSHRYNLMLGVALLGVILFNPTDFRELHGMFAVSFFVGNVVVMWWFSDIGENTVRFRKWFVAPIVAVLLAWSFIDWFTLFWAEEVSLLVIAVHFWLDSKESVRYNAVKRTVYPWTSPHQTVSKAASPDPSEPGATEGV